VLSISSAIRLLPGYFKYFFEAVDDHSLHSPYVFDLYQGVFKTHPDARRLAVVEQIRGQYLKNITKLDTSNPGAGSVKRGDIRKVSDIARISGSGDKTCRLLDALVRYFKPLNIVELGTSLGLGTMCLAGRSDSRVYTFEANDSIADLAGANFKMAGFKNIDLIRGPIDQTLPVFISRQSTIDMAFIDANHTEEALLRYFEWLLPLMSSGGLLVVDDIRWSPGMYSGWKQLAQRKDVALSLDLMQIGLLVFIPDFLKAHYYLEY